MWICLFDWEIGDLWEGMVVRDRQYATGLDCLSDQTIKIPAGRAGRIISIDEYDIFVDYPYELENDEVGDATVFYSNTATLEYWRGEAANG